MKGFVTSQKNYENQSGRLELISEFYWDREPKFLDAINKYFDMHHDFGKASDTKSIEFCQEFIDDFNPDTMFVMFGEEIGGYGFVETYCKVYKILK